MSNLKSFIKNLDIFPGTFEFNLNGKGLNKSFIGGVTSLLAIILFLIVAIYTLNSFFSKRNPLIINELYYEPNMLPVDLNKTDIQMFLSLWDISKLTKKNISSPYSDIKETVIDISKSLTGVLNSKTIIGNFIDCNVDNQSSFDFYNNYTKKYGGFGLSGYLCSNFIPETIKFGGDLFGGHLNFLDFNITLDLCSFEKNETNCKNPDYWKNSNFKYNFNLVLYDTFSDILSQKGYTKFTNSYIFDFNYNQITNLDIKILKNKISSDTNFLYNLYDNVNDTFLSIESISISNSPRTDFINNPNIYTINVHLDLPIHYLLITRIYPKLDSILANISAIYSIIFFFANTLISILNYGNVEFYLMKNLYYIDDDHTKKNQKLKSAIKRRKNNLIKEELEIINSDRISIEHSKEIVEGVGDHNHSVNIINNDKIRKKLKDSLKYKDKEINNYLHGRKFEKHPFLWFIYSCCEKKADKSLKYFFYGQEFLKQDLNIIVLLRKLILFENVLEILFENYQLDTIKGIHNRKIYENMDIENIIINNHTINQKHKDSTIEVKNFLNGFYKCENNKTLKDIKILKLIDN